MSVYSDVRHAGRRAGACPLDGSVALVTGSSRGIGAAVARAMAARGAAVLLHGRGSDQLDSLADELDATALPIDLADSDAAEVLAEKALGVHGRVDVVVHCAGVGHYGDLAEMSGDRVDRLLDVDLRVPLQLSRLLLPPMVQAGSGHLCFVASIAGLTGVAHEAAYSAVKAGMIALADALRLELAHSGVGVSAICPSAVDTEFFDGRGARYDRRFPRMWTAEKVAETVVQTIERGDTWRVLPRWLTLAPTVRLLAPRLYDTLAVRFG